MEYRILGRTGVTVSNLCLGAMMFGPWGDPDHDNGIRTIHRALDAGINFLDTADVYSQGESEEIVAKAIAGRRDDIVLATKFHGAMGEDPNQQGSSRRWIIREVENSLRRLGTDWIDLYQVHRPRTDTDVEETLSALTDLVHQGKVRYVGSSTFPASQIVEAQWVARDRNLQRFVTEQPPYSILVRHTEADILPTCARHGMGVLTYSPLAGGWLSGRWRTDTDLPTPSPARQRLVEPVRHVTAGQPAEAGGGRGARPARRGGGPVADRDGHRVRPQPPRRHLGDHRPPHPRAAGVPAPGRRHPPQRRRARPDRRDRRPRHPDQPRRLQLRQPRTPTVRPSTHLTGHVYKHSADLTALRLPGSYSGKPAGDAAATAADYCRSTQTDGVTPWRKYSWFLRSWSPAMCCR